MDTGIITINPKKNRIETMAPALSPRATKASTVKIIATKNRIQGANSSSMLGAFRLYDFSISLPTT